MNPVNNSCSILGRALLAALALGFAATGSVFAGSDDARYYVNDHLATTVGIADAAGEIAALEADAFGSRMSAADNAGRFTGKPYDADLGAYVFPFRNYRADEARWMSADPSGFPDGVNAVTYTRNPHQEIDPTGLVRITRVTVFEGLEDIMMHGGVHGRMYTTFTNTQGAQFSVYGDAENGFYASASRGFEYKLEGLRILPEVGSSGGGGVVTQQYMLDVATHEDGHWDVAKAFAASLYAKIEVWSANYSSNLFKTYADAHAAAQNDLGSSINALIGQYGISYSNDHEFQHQSSYPVLQNGVWTVINPNWAGAAIAKVGAYSPSFTKTPGNFKRE